eukprot:TRINITY_DN34600_c0_g1_i1.p1 TRINITY_DN34600_c0_g1~~TRINITY_DN34600_c0_g1_i1.p1  ORF type:complete len:364 (-),score=48.43 TRINITY_DN34600_c0_g1_i1:280-1371(-)
MWGFSQSNCIPLRAQLEGNTMEVVQQPMQIEVVKNFVVIDVGCAENFTVILVSVPEDYKISSTQIEMKKRIFQEVTEKAKELVEFSKTKIVFEEFDETSPKKATTKLKNSVQVKEILNPMFPPIHDMSNELNIKILNQSESINFNQFSQDMYQDELFDSKLFPKLQMYLRGVDTSKLPNQEQVNASIQSKFSRCLKKNVDTSILTQKGQLNSMNSPFFSFDQVANKIITKEDTDIKSSSYEPFKKKPTLYQQNHDLSHSSIGRCQSISQLSSINCSQQITQSRSEAPNNRTWGQNEIMEKDLKELSKCLLSENEIMKYEFIEMIKAGQDEKLMAYILMDVMQKQIQKPLKKNINYKLKQFDQN